jgi:hypothetical protein
MNKNRIWQWPLRVGVGIVWALSMGALLTACSDSAVDDLSPADSNVIVTNFDRQANFAQYSTFSLADSVLVESNDRYSQSALPVEQRVVSRLATELSNRGFTRLAGGQTADLGVVVTRVNNRYTGVAVNPFAGFGNAWGLGPGWGGGGWGWGAGGWGGFNDPFFFPTYYQYQTTERSWRIDVVDLKNRPIITPNTNPNDPNSRLRVVYSAQLLGNGIFDTNNIDQLIADMFAQSPYLRR